MSPLSARRSLRLVHSAISLTTCSSVPPTESSRGKDIRSISRSRTFGPGLSECRLAGDANSVARLVDAIVLPSLFEEQFVHEESSVKATVLVCVAMASRWAWRSQRSRPPIPGRFTCMSGPSADVCRRLIQSRGNSETSDVRWRRSPAASGAGLGVIFGLALCRNRRPTTSASGSRCSQGRCS